MGLNRWIALNARKITYQYHRGDIDDVLSNNYRISGATLFS